jgi:YVTN family beta-propeller protein
VRSAKPTALTCVLLASCVAISALGCGGSGGASRSAAGERATGSQSAAARAHRRPPRNALVPPLLDPHNVYAADRAGMLSPVVRHFPERIYVPNSLSDTVSVIDPKTYKVTDTFGVGALPQHVTPAYDLKTLWVDNDAANTLTAIDPLTGRPGRSVAVADPYNLYFTPNGRFAIVVAEALQRLDFRNAQTMSLHHSLAVPCKGVDHMDFTADGRYLLASCEFGARMVEVDVRRERVVRAISLQSGAMPQDVKISPDGRTFYVADMMHGGVWMIGAGSMHVEGFIRTGAGAHGLYPSRDAKLLYVSDRGEGAISVISFARRAVVRKWVIPGGGSPDMGGVSADGRVLWLSGRYDGVVYAIDTQSGKLLAKIPVGRGPHGLSVFPQPGRYSLGHTGVFR